MKSGRIIYAPNVHQGGGRALLLPLLEMLKEDDDVTFVLDERLQLPAGLMFAGKVYRVKASLLARLFFEWRLRGLLRKDMILLGMGNLPPLLAGNGIQKVLVQNRYLIDKVPLDSFRLPVRLRLTVERWWLQSRSHFVNKFIVQTPTMQRLINNCLSVDAEIAPFIASAPANRIERREDEKQYDFLYVASGEPHKNHKRLVEAWIKLTKKNLFPSLCLTLDSKRFPELCSWIDVKSKANDLNITMVGECSHENIQALYRISSATVYPSLFESFGLPLIESVQEGVPVLACNLSYVSDVIHPTDQFNPLSSDSIADAVCRFSFKPSVLNIDLLSADEFLQRVFKKDMIG